jgi:hypothetical protein
MKSGCAPCAATERRSERSERNLSTIEHGGSCDGIRDGLAWIFWTGWQDFQEIQDFRDVGGNTKHWKLMEV